MLVVDLMYQKEVLLVPKLNIFLENEPFGPYDHISEAVNQLTRLQKSKPEKAAKLQKLLNSFAQLLGSDLVSLQQWPIIMQMKRERDAFSHTLSSSAQL